MARINIDPTRPFSYAIWDFEKQRYTLLASLYWINDFNMLESTRRQFINEINQCKKISDGQRVVMRHREERSK